MAKIESELVIKVTADTKELKQTIAHGIKAAFRDGWNAANTEIQDSEVELYWQHSESKTVYDNLLK